APSRPKHRPTRLAQRRGMALPKTGPSEAWMPTTRLHGRTRAVSRLGQGHSSAPRTGAGGSASPRARYLPSRGTRLRAGLGNGGDAGLAQGLGELRALEALARDVGAADRLRGREQAQQLGALRVRSVLVPLAAALVGFAH